MNKLNEQDTTLIIASVRYLLYEWDADHKSATDVCEILKGVAEYVGLIGSYPPAPSAPDFRDP